MHSGLDVSRTPFTCFVEDALLATARLRCANSRASPSKSPLAPSFTLVHHFTPRSTPTPLEHHNVSSLPLQTPLPLFTRSRFPTFSRFQSSPAQHFPSSYSQPPLKPLAQQCYHTSSVPVSPTPHSPATVTSLSNQQSNTSHSSRSSSRTASFPPSPTVPLPLLLPLHLNQQPTSTLVHRNNACGPN